MKYYCDECGTLYDTIEEVTACEKKHADEKKKAEEIANRKTERWAEVCKAKAEYETLQREYMKDYGSVKKVRINPFYPPLNFFDI